MFVPSGLDILKQVNFRNLISKEPPFNLKGKPISSPPRICTVSQLFLCIEISYFIIGKLFVIAHELVEGVGRDVRDETK